MSTCRGTTCQVHFIFPIVERLVGERREVFSGPKHVGSSHPNCASARYEPGTVSKVGKGARENVRRVNVILVHSISGRSYACQRTSAEVDGGLTVCLAIYTSYHWHRSPVNNVAAATWSSAISIHLSVTAGLKCKSRTSASMRPHVLEIRKRHSTQARS